MLLTLASAGAVAVSPAGVVQAASGLSTLVLVIVSGMYVHFPSELVTAQREAVELQRLSDDVRRKSALERDQCHAAVLVWREYMDGFIYWSSARNLAPDLHEESEHELRDFCEKLSLLANGIVPYATDVPDSIHLSALRVPTSLLKLSNEVLAWPLTLSQARLESSSAEEPDAIRDAMEKAWAMYWSEDEKPSWSDFLSGRRVDEVERETDAYANAVYKIARGETPFDS